MQYEEMVNTLKKSGQEILDSWNAQDASMSHMLTGIYDGYLEVQEALENYAATPNEQTRGHIIEELGDLTFYVVGLTQDVGLDLTEAKLASTTIPSFRQVVMETTTALKRQLYYRKEVDKEQLAVQLLTILVHIGHEAKKISSTLESVMQENQRKLSKRYPQSSYSNEAANSRQDKE